MVGCSAASPYWFCCWSTVRHGRTWPCSSWQLAAAQGTQLPPLGVWIDGTDPDDDCCRQSRYIGERWRTEVTSRSEARLAHISLHRAAQGSGWVLEEVGRLPSLRQPK